MNVYLYLKEYCFVTEVVNTLALTTFGAMSATSCLRNLVLSAFILELSCLHSSNYNNTAFYAF